MLHKLIYKIGIIIINPKIFRNYKYLLKSQHFLINELEKYQLKRLKELLEHAYSNTRYYKELFDKNDFKPNEINSLCDLHRIPILTKDELLNNLENIQITNYPEKLVFSETSGSTGKPLVFYRNKDWDAWHRASVFRGYSWYGVSPWEKNGYFWGYNYSLKKRLKTKLLDYLQNRFRLFSYEDEEIKAFIKKLKNATYLEGYSSMIYEVAKIINSNIDKHMFNLKMIKGTSEKIFPNYQAEVKRAFGKKIISEYGAAEAGIIAFECPYGSMHINMETVIVEEIENEILVTNLVSKSFPIIRYKLGDYIKIAKNEKCKCGMQHHIVKEVFGRVGKVIYGHTQQYPSLTLYYVFKNLALEKGIILNYQAIQDDKGMLELRIEQKLDETSKSELQNEFKKYFKEDLNFNIFDAYVLKDGNKKKVDFISYL